MGFSQRGYECCGIPFASPSKKTKKRFNWRVVKRELWPQSCINREYLEDSRVMRQIIGINKKPFINNVKGWFIIW